MSRVIPIAPTASLLPSSDSLVPQARDVLALTALAWSLPVPSAALRPAPAAPAIHAHAADAGPLRIPLNESREAQGWPYWPAYPGMAAGWR